MQWLCSYSVPFLSPCATLVQAIIATTGATTTCATQRVVCRHVVLRVVLVSPVAQGASLIARLIDRFQCRATAIFKTTIATKMESLSAAIQTIFLWWVINLLFFDFVRSQLFDLRFSDQIFSHDAYDYFTVPPFSANVWLTRTKLLHRSHNYRLLLSRSRSSSMLPSELWLQLPICQTWLRSRTTFSSSPLYYSSSL